MTLTLFRKASFSQTTRRPRQTTLQHHRCTLAESAFTLNKMQGVGSVEAEIKCRRELAKGEGRFAERHASTASTASLPNNSQTASSNAEATSVRAGRNRLYPEQDAGGGPCGSRDQMSTRACEGSGAFRRTERVDRVSPEQFADRVEQRCSTIGARWPKPPLP